MKKKLFNFILKAGGSASGQTIVESLICSLIIIVFFIGLLQIFHLGVAKLLTNYSAFRAARTYCVGFRCDDQLNLVGRSARVGAIGASGKLIQPDNVFSSGDPITQFGAEKIMIPEYLSGEKWWMSYEYWDGGNTYDPQFYGKVSPLKKTWLQTSWYSDIDDPDNGAEVVTFNQYPFPFFDLFDRNRIIFRTIKNDFRDIDITGSSSITNYANSYISAGP